MMIQLLILSLLGAVLYPLLKKELPSYAILFAVVIAIYMLAIFCEYVTSALEWIPVLQDSTGKEGFLILLKATGIMICADYGRDLCKDAGSDSMAGCISLAGRVMVLVVALPLLENIYRCILGLSQ